MVELYYLLMRKSLYAWGAEVKQIGAMNFGRHTKVMLTLEEGYIVLGANNFK